MTQIRILCTFIALLFFCSARAQGDVLPIGTAQGQEGGSTLLRHASGDYFIGGYHDDEAMIIRLKPGGEVVWSRSYDFGSGPDHVLSMQITSDNFLIGCGNERTASGDIRYGFIFKMDLEGNLIWNKELRGQGAYMWTQSVQELTNGNYRILGSYIDNKLDSYAADLDPQTGGFVWDSAYARSPFANGWDESFYDQDILPLNQATYIVGRFQKAHGNTTYRPSLTKLKPDGALDWCKTYLYNNSTSGGRLYSFDIDVDGDSLILNILGVQGGASPPFQCGLMKTDADGDISWAKLFKSSSGQDLRSYNMVSTPDGYVLAGWIQNGDKQLFMIKTNKRGELIWSKSYGGSGIEEVFLFASNSRVIIDGDYLVTVGRTKSFGSSFDLFYVRVNNTTGELEGSGCTDELSVVEVDLPAFQEDYPLITSGSPMELSDPNVDPQPLDLEPMGSLQEVVTDTIVSGDTLYLCEGETVQVKANWSPTLNYRWNTGDAGQTKTLSTPGMYWVEITGGPGCVIWSDTVYVEVTNEFLNLPEQQDLCDGESFVLDAFSSSATYLWQDGSTSSSLLVSTPGLYWVEAQKGTCIDRDSILVDVRDAPVVTLGEDTTLCQGELLFLDVSTSDGTYTWQDASSNGNFVVSVPGLYWVEVDVSSCKGRDSIQVDFVDALVPDLGNDTVLCDGEPLVLDVTTQQGSYLWQDGSTLSSYVVTASGTYHVEVNVDRCVVKDTVFIGYENLPQVNLGNDTLLCDSSTLTLNAFVFGAAYVWQDGSSFADFIVTEPGSYWVRVMLNGCESYGGISVNYDSLPKVNVEDITLCLDSSEFVDVTQDPGVTYEWQDGDTDPIREVFEGGRYEIRLTNYCGTRIDTFQVNITSCICDLFVPNAFTPDGDGVNDEFYVETPCELDRFEFRIFDRWGQLAFETFDPYTRWDGRTSNQLAQQDVYTWRIEYRFVGEQTQVVSGHVVLLK